MNIDLPTEKQIWEMAKTAKEDIIEIEYLKAVNDFRRAEESMNRMTEKLVQMSAEAKDELDTKGYSTVLEQIGRLSQDIAREQAIMWSKAETAKSLEKFIKQA